jgi:sporulation protein YlmC with PRC-barrel domain
MRSSISIGAALFLALSAGGALAQQPQPAPTQPDVQLQTAIPAGADALVGKKVVTPKGEDIGEIRNVLVEDNGQVAALIVRHGAMLGLGGKQTAVPWDKVTISGDMITLNMAPEQVSQLPVYEDAR